MLDILAALATFIDTKVREVTAPPARPAVTASRPDATPQAPAQPVKAVPVEELVSQARAAVRHETTPGERGKVLHRFSFPDGAVVEFTDRPRRGSERAARERVVVFEGSVPAAQEPHEIFMSAGRTAGLAPEAVEALRFVSAHEGGFDAINTWDSARFSWGFIQFAGGRGLPPLLGHMKTRNPELFNTLLADYGIDVGEDRDGDPQPLYRTASGRVLRGKAAEQAYGDNPLNVALFIRAARVPEVKQLQVEAAIRDYAAPALAATYGGTPISRVVRSVKGMAMLIDRKVHEGNVGRFSRALDAVGVNPALVDDASARLVEAEVMRRVVSDAAGSQRMIRDRLEGILASSLPGPDAALLP